MMTLKNTKPLALLFLLTLSVLTFSCKEESKSNNEAVKTEQNEESTPQNTTNDKTANEDKLNPAHGEPGHRCDIPVGAPLNTKPANQQQNIQVNGNPVQQATTNENTNPPHGEPGHDCGTPVGAPLNN